MVHVASLVGLGLVAPSITYGHVSGWDSQTYDPLWEISASRGLGGGTCLIGSADCRPRCNDAAGCYTVGGGEDCTFGGGPTNNLCDDCTACATSLGSASPTASPGPTVASNNFYEKTCDEKDTRPCMPGWCAINDDPSCSDEALSTASGAGDMLLNQLASLECNPYCTENKDNYCPRLSEMLRTGHGSIKVREADSSHQG